MKQSVQTTGRRRPVAVIVGALLSTVVFGALTWFGATQTLAADYSDWQLVTPASGLPADSHENSFVEVNGKFYLVGGRSDGAGKPADIFDPATSTWTQGAAPPLELHHFQAVEYNGKIYAVAAMTGPCCGDDEVGVDYVYIYDPVTDSWSQGDAIPQARRRGGAGAVVYEGKIYAVGGFNFGHGGPNTVVYPWFDVYDPATGTWTPLPDAPRARDHFNIALVGDKLFVAGGRVSDDINFNAIFDNTIPEVDVYDFNTGQWSTLPAGSNLPTPRAGTATVAVDNDLLVIGGEAETSAPGTNNGAYDITEALDTTTNTWRTLDNMTTSRHGTNAVVYDGAVWIAAGAATQGGAQELNSIERLAYTESCDTIRVNAGGMQTAAADASQPPWAEDSELNPSQFHNMRGDENMVFVPNPLPTIDMSHPSITDAVPASLFQSERFDEAGGNPMQWAFPVNSGETYVLRLFFAETFFEDVGLREFDVQIEGVTRLNNYDIFLQAGGKNRGVVESFVIQTADSVLNVDFEHVSGKDNPSIYGIELLRASCVDNVAPQVTNPGPRVNTVGSTVNLPIVASDYEGHTLSYSANGLPPGLTINSSTGVISGTVESGGGTADFPLILQNDLLVGEVESVPTTGDWTEETTVTGASGVYYEWRTGDPETEIIGSGQGILSYPIFIDQPGDYRFRLRSAAPAFSEHNDAWIRILGEGSRPVVEHEGNERWPESNQPNGWFKLWQNDSNDQWSWKSFNVDAVDGEVAHDIYFRFDQPGSYAIEISGRATQFKIDRFVLYDEDNVNEATAFDLSKAQTFSGSDDYNVTVSVTDNGNPSKTSTTSFVWTVNPAGGINQPPEIAQVNNQTVNENATLQIPVTATDPNSDPITLTASVVDSGAQAMGGDFYTFTDQGGGAGAFTFTPAKDDAGTYTATVNASDGNGGTDQMTFTLTVTDTNRAPVLSNIGNQQVAENDMLTINLSASDLDDDPLSFTEQGLPTFATLTDNGNGTAVITATPTTSDSGNYEVMVTVSDGQGGTDSETFTISVGDVNRPPELGVLQDQTLNEGDTVQIPVSATDPDGEAVTLSVSGAAFASLVDNGDGTGTLTLSPQAGDAGSYEIVVTATDAQSLTDEATVKVTVNMAGANDPGLSNLNTTGNLTSAPFAPTFNWTHMVDGSSTVPGEWYGLFVVNEADTLLYNQWFQASEVCTGTACTVTPAPSDLFLINGTYEWTVQVYTEADGIYGTSNPVGFTIAAADAPGVIARTAPADDAVVATAPVTLEWNADPNASWYRIYLSSFHGFTLDQWYAAAEVCTGAACATPALELEPGTYQWYMSSYGPLGEGPWGDPDPLMTTFYVGSVVAVTSPADDTALTDVFNGTTTFQWAEETGATWYGLYVANPDATQAYFEWLPAEDICVSGICSQEVLLLQNGTFTWYLAAYYEPEAVIGPWLEYELTLDVPLPAVPTRIGPQGEVTTPNVVFEWQAAPNAGWYNLQVNGSSSVDQWYNSAEVCQATTCSVSVPLSNGSYTWTLRAWSPAGFTEFQPDAFSFNLNLDAPGEITQTTPAADAAVAAGDVTFQWQADTNAGWYQIYVDGMTIVDQWVDGSTTCSGGTCTYTATLEPGSYTWYTRAWGPGGLGNWNTGASFTVN